MQRPDINRRRNERNQRQRRCGRQTQPIAKQTAADESAGAKVSKEGDKTTGGGLAWGGGCSPTLTPELVLFTDNQEIVNLIALDMKTGEVVASMPVLDDLPEGYQVAVENSAIVYDDGQGKVSTIVCNWFGAGNAGLANPDSDSSIQSYANIYDMNWLTKGNSMIAPGVERVDTIKTENGYEMKSVWSRNDLSDTSIMKLSTATGYIYGYDWNCFYIFYLQVDSSQRRRIG